MPSKLCASHNFLFYPSCFAFLLAFLLPNHYFPWATAYQEFLSFFGVILLVLLLLFRQSSIIVTPLFLAFSFSSVIPLCQLAAGTIYFSGDAWVASAYLFGFSLVILIGYNLSVDAKSRQQLVHALAAVLVVGAVVSVWIGLRQWLMLSGSIWIADLPPGARPFANLAQPNNFATLSCMGLAGVIYFYEKGQLDQLASGILAFFLLFGVALTQSRTPWVGVVAVTVFWTWKSHASPLRLPLKGLVGWVGAYIFLVVTFPFFAEWLLLPGSGPLERAQSLERWDMWVQFWHAIWLQPFWGYGWNQVSVAQVAVSLASPVPIFAEHSHNIFLDILLWNGVVVGGFIICSIAVWLARLTRNARTSESLFVLLAVGFVLVHAMLEYPLEYAFFLFPVGLLLGIASSERRATFEVSVPRWALAGLLLLGVGLFGWIWHEYRIIEEDHRLMRFESARIGDLKAEQAAPDVVLLTQLREFTRFARTPAAVGMDATQLEWMRRVAHRYPYVPSLLRYSLALAFNNQPDAARDQLRILRALHGDRNYAEARHSLQDTSIDYPQLASVLKGLPVIELTIKPDAP